MQQIGSAFYVNSSLETVVDPYSPPVIQNQLLDELRKCDKLVQLDWRYAKIVQGASKMPWNMVWAARNQDDPVSDTDLAELKDLAWNEVIKKRYLPSIPGTLTVGETTASMLEMVREMNLQRRRFQIMGLHEQVEACEIHLVLHLCQAGILHSDRYRVIANRFRRHERLFEAFGLAVGAFVCASAPFTLGAAMARYERDLQYEYKKNVTALFVWVLQQNMGGFDAVMLMDEDYVARIARLIIVWPGEDSKKGKRIGFAKKTKKGGDDDDDDDDNGDLRNMMLSSIGIAQNDADKAWAGVIKLTERVDYGEKLWGSELETHKTQVEKELSIHQRQVENDLQANMTDLEATMDRIFNEMKDKVNNTMIHEVETRVSRILTSNEIRSAEINRKIDDLQQKLNTVQLGPVRPGGVPVAYDDTWKQQIDRRMDSVTGGFEAFKGTIPALIDTATQDRMERLGKFITDGSAEMEQRILDDAEKKLAESTKTILDEITRQTGQALANANTTTTETEDRIKLRLDGVDARLKVWEDSGIQGEFTKLKEENAQMSTDVGEIFEDFNKRLKIEEDKLEKHQADWEQNETVIDTHIFEQSKEIEALKANVDLLQNTLQDLQDNQDNFVTQYGASRNVIIIKDEDEDARSDHGSMAASSTDGRAAGGKRSRDQVDDSREYGERVANNAGIATVVHQVLHDLDLKAEIIEEVRRLIEARIIQTRSSAPAVQGMDVSDQVAQPMDVTDFEARIRSLELLFREITDTTASPFTRPGVPQHGDFRPPPRT